RSFSTSSGLSDLFRCAVRDSAIFDQFAGRGHDLVSRAWFRFGHEAIVVSTHSSCQEENHRAGRAARQVASGSGGRPKVADPPARRVAFSNDSADVNPKTWLSDGT